MDHQVPAVCEKGVLRLLEPLDLPEHTELTVTLAMPNAPEKTVSAGLHVRYPTRSQPLSLLDPSIGTMSAGGDALKDTEALYDQNW